MRTAVAAGLAGLTVLATLGLTAAVSVSAINDIVYPTTLAGGPRVTEDPDAPIRTGRWDGEPTRTVALAGGPSVETAPPAATPARQPVELTALTPPPPAEAPRTALPQVGLAGAAFRPMGQQALAGGPPRVTLAMTTDADPVAPGSGLDAGETFAGRSLAPRAPRQDQRIDARRMLVSIGPGPEDRKKGRWFVFAAGSGEAFGLNLIRDPARGGVRRAGWSVERLAEFGKAQLGIGWRKGDRQIAFSAARREIGAYGVKREDTVFGLTFTVSGRPPQKVRREQRLPKA
ncbi:MAG: hypothetical protein KA105_04400 [Caulobacter sp.]|nr:hypothetical protein [Caulobacter sp.]